MRCIRAGVKCVTGYTKPLGRSVADAATTSSQTKPQPAAALSVDMTRNGPKDTRLTPKSRSFPLTTTTIESTSLTAEDMRSSPWLLPEENENDHLLISQDCLPIPAREDSLDNLLDSCVHPPLSTDALFFSTVFTPINNMDEGNGPSFGDSDSLSSLRSLSDPATAGRMADSDTTMEELQQQRPSCGVESSIMSGAECDLRLSQLSLDLCRQLQACMTRSQLWNTTTMGPKPSENPFRVIGKGPNGQSDSNSFSHALCSTSEFLDILQLYSCGDATRPSPSLGSILTLLLSYLRIIAVFDSLFLHLYELLYCSTTSSSGPTEEANFQILPGLHLTGFSVQQGSLQTKILIQAIQHQFEMIEKMLGLPAELRVSDRRDINPMGFLGGEWAQSLVQAVMNGPHSGEGAMSVPFDRDRAVGSLGSLRQNIMKIRQLLDI